MSRMNLARIDNFFYIFTVVMVVLSAFVVVVFKEIFSSLRTTSDIAVSFSENELKVDKNKLQGAADLIDSKHVVELNSTAEEDEK